MKANYTEIHNGIEIVRIANDVNGNPRYAVYRSNFEKESERAIYNRMGYAAWESDYIVNGLAESRARRCGFRKSRKSGWWIIQDYRTPRDICDDIVATK